MVDDIVVSTGEGTTSFEDDADPLDGWTVPGPPAGSEPNVTDWNVGTSADVPPPVGEIAAASFGRLPEMLDFMSDTFGSYPFSTAGGVLDEVPALSFALETQTRPVYGQDFFYNAFDGDSVVLHENAHQWFGDSLTIERWQDIWLNEGFATYAEWLWSEHDGGLTAQEWFENRYFFFDETSRFWEIPIADPGPEDLFSIAVYWRGAMTLHALRAEVGDATFFRIMRTWVRQQTGDTVRTDEFIALAERLAARQLDEFFDTWLMAPGRPVQDQSATSLRVADADASIFGRARTGDRQHQPA
jgi:Peptidase family M1 domain